MLCMTRYDIRQTAPAKTYNNDLMFTRSIRNQKGSNSVFEGYDLTPFWLQADGS